MIKLIIRLNLRYIQVKFWLRFGKAPVWGKCPVFGIVHIFWLKTELILKAVGGFAYSFTNKWIKNLTRESAVEVADTES